MEDDVTGESSTKKRAVHTDELIGTARKDEATPQLEHDVPDRAQQTHDALDATFIPLEAQSRDVDGTPPWRELVTPRPEPVVFPFLLGLAAQDA